MQFWTFSQTNLHATCISESHPRGVPVDCVPNIPSFIHTLCVASLPSLAPVIFSREFALSNLFRCHDSHPMEVCLAVSKMPRGRSESTV